MNDLLRLTLATEDARGLTAALLEEHLHSLARVDGARVIILEGVSGTFCRGLDLSTAATEAREVGRASIEGTLGLLHRLLESLRAAPQPVVAIVDGDAMGGGVGLVAAADVVLASSRATFSLPELLFGLIPGVIFPYLAGRIGPGRARALALTGEKVTATRAAEWGLVDQVVEDLAGAEPSIVRRLLQQDLAAQAAFKKLLATSAGADPESWSEAAIAAFSALLAGNEAPRRISRFMEGRKPWEEDS